MVTRFCNGILAGRQILPATLVDVELSSFRRTENDSNFRINFQGTNFRIVDQLNRLSRNNSFIRSSEYSVTWLKCGTFFNLQNISSFLLAYYEIFN